MKKIYTLLLVSLGILTFAQAQVIYDDFERNRPINYDFVHGDLMHYVANPDMVGNTSSHVGQYMRNASELYDVLVTVPPGQINDLSDYVSGTKKMTVDVWSPAANIPVQITLEDGAVTATEGYPFGRHSEYYGTTSVANAWETITLEHGNTPDPTIQNTAVTTLVLLFNSGTETSDTYYFDNLMGPEYDDPCAPSIDPLVEFEDFDCSRNLVYAFTSGWLNKVENPWQTGINTSSFCGYLVTNPDQDATDVVIGDLAGTVDFSVHNQLKMKVRSVSGGSLTVSMQAGTVEQGAATTTFTSGGTWEEINLDFSELTTNTSVDRMVLLFNAGVAGNDSVWFDDVKLNGFEVVGIDNKIERSFSLEQNSPNPFGDETNIRFSLVNSGNVSLSISDLRGRVIDNLIQEESFFPGEYQYTINSTDLKAGIYFYTLQVDGYTQTKKMMVK